MNNHRRWRIGALASAIALLGSLASVPAYALSLGRITVQSALGEPLRAEIDVTNINADEMASLRVGVAPAEAFKAAGLEYTAAVVGLDIKLQRRADGRPYLRLSSSRPITEPFVDLILETGWASGRITRDYTMLFDPPNLRTAVNAVEPAAPAFPRAPAATSTAAELPSREKPSRPSSAPLAVAAKPAPATKAPAVKTSSAEAMPASGRQVVVQPGDTASKIALGNKPAGVSLDQMLAALLSSNPNAFVGGNINVIKSGAVLDLPGEKPANAQPGDDRTVVAQSKDFNAFRRKLAEGAASTQVASPERQAGGKLQAKVEDRAARPAAPDKLTLSSGAVQAKPASAAEEKIAAQQNAKDTSSRVAELSKNISDLNKLGSVLSTGPSAAAPGIALPASSAPVLGADSTLAASPVSPAPAAPAAAPATQAQGSGSDIASPAAAASSAAIGMPATVAPAPASAASAALQVKPDSVKNPDAPATAPTQEGFFAQALDNPLLLLGAGGVLLLLGGLMVARYRKNKKMGHVDSSFLESRLQADSFFGASGGQHVDTRENNPVVSSMAYTPSQLDTSGDVDPVAEADVYLAYGRDQQAEEILKEALRNHPERIAIHTKLVEIYAKRRDGKALDRIATEAFKLTQGHGSEWRHIAKIGREINPDTLIYQSRPEQPVVASKSNSLAFSSPDNTAPMPLSSASALKHALDFAPHKERISLLTQQANEQPVVNSGLARPSAFLDDLDLDLDLDIDSVPASLTSTLSPGTTRPMPSAFLDDLDVDLDMDLASAPAPLTAYAAVAPPAVSPAAKASFANSDFMSNGLDFTPNDLTLPPLPQVRRAPEIMAGRSGMLEFDLSSLSLDLPSAPLAPAPALKDALADPLEIKFLLAEEFRVLGDSDGARSLADEVLAKAAGPLKVKAQAFLNTLS